MWLPEVAAEARAPPSAEPLEPDNAAAGLRLPPGSPRPGRYRRRRRPASAAGRRRGGPAGGSPGDLPQGSPAHGEWPADGGPFPVRLVGPPLRLLACPHRAAGHTEADVLEDGVGGAAAADRGAHAPGFVGPAAAAQGAVVAVAGGVGVVPAPFPDVAERVVQAPGVGLLLADGMRPLEVIEADPCLLYTSPSPRDATLSRMPSSA